MIRTTTDAPLPTVGRIRSTRENHRNRRIRGNPRRRPAASSRRSRQSPWRHRTHRAGDWHDTSSSLSAAPSRLAAPPATLLERGSPSAESKTVYEVAKVQTQRSPCASGIAKAAVTFSPALLRSTTSDKIFAAPVLGRVETSAACGRNRARDQAHLPHRPVDLADRVLQQDKERPSAANLWLVILPVSRRQAHHGLATEVMPAPATRVCAESHGQLEAEHSRGEVASLLFRPLTRSPVGRRHPAPVSSDAGEEQAPTLPGPATTAWTRTSPPSLTASVQASSRAFG
jgi:hypothetical protein